MKIIQLQQFSLRRKILLPLCILSAALSSCRRGFSDPFRSNPIGEKITIEASLVNSMPLTQENDSSRPRSVLFRIASQDSSASSKSSVWGVGLEARVATISLKDKNGTAVTRTWNEILVSAEPKNCTSQSQDVKILLATNKDLTVICDRDFSNNISSAVLIIVKTEDGIEHSITSWGTNRSDFGDSDIIVVYTLLI